MKSPVRKFLHLFFVLFATVLYAAPPPGSGAAGQSPEDVILIQDSERSTMRYLTPTMRTAARALGFGGVGTYAVLRGPRAKLRLKTRTPSFVVAVPRNAQPDSYMTLASFAVRRNGTREVIVGGGYMSYSTGIHQDRIVETAGELLENQTGAPKGFSLFRVTPTQPLPKGKYAVVTYNSQVPVMGWFTAGMDSYYDFGVD